MIIDLASIRDVPKSIDVQLDSAVIDLSGEAFSLVGPAALTVEMFRQSLGVEVRGRVTADISIGCSRCLAEVERHFDIPFRSVFVEADRAETEADRELDVEQLDETTSTDGHADLADLAREQILLAIPEQILCVENCKGLCPQCGENLNLINCKCAEDDIDPRWAALKSLK